MVSDPVRGVRGPPSCRCAATDREGVAGPLREGRQRLPSRHGADEAAGQRDSHRFRPRREDPYLGHRAGPEQGERRRAAGPVADGRHVPRPDRRRSGWRQGGGHPGRRSRRCRRADRRGAVTQYCSAGLGFDGDAGSRGGGDRGATAVARGETPSGGPLVGGAGSVSPLRVSESAVAVPVRDAALRWPGPATPGRGRVDDEPMTIASTITAAAAAQGRPEPTGVVEQPATPSRRDDRPPVVRPLKVSPGVEGCNRGERGPGGRRRLGPRLLRPVHGQLAWADRPPTQSRRDRPSRLPGEPLALSTLPLCSRSRSAGRARGDDRSHASIASSLKGAGDRCGPARGGRSRTPCSIAGSRWGSSPGGAGAPSARPARGAREVGRRSRRRPWPRPTRAPSPRPGLSAPPRPPATSPRRAGGRRVVAQPQRAVTRRHGGDGTSPVRSGPWARPSPRGGFGTAPQGAVVLPCEPVYRPPPGRSVEEGRPVEAVEDRSAVGTEMDGGRIDPEVGHADRMQI